VEAGAVAAVPDLHRWEAGRGAPVLCIHETATAGDVWRGLAAALDDRVRVIAYDRCGWGRSEAPATYLRTTVGEQAADAARVLAASEVGEALVCGAGIGAVVALDLLLRRPEVALGAVLVEPPLLALVPEATETLSSDAAAMRHAVASGGPRVGLDLYVSGTLAAIGAGADRLPEDQLAGALERPLSLFAELAAVPGWPLPLGELRFARAPSRIVVSDATPALIRRAADRLAARLAGAQLRELPGAGPAHVDQAQSLAQVVLELV
jgi:pimeloyl-ACP methyl ester carboxylesterase